jgi:succinoglycan biosynthesis transport protein ExoP
MSRIHEALKRAQEERVASLSVQKAEEPIDVGLTIHPVKAEVSAPMVSKPQVMPEEKTTIFPGISRFEDLWESCARPQWKPDHNLIVFCNSDPFVPGAEQFRTLRSRLYKVRESQRLHTVLVSSSIPAEGKTLTATNLAYVMARQQGSRVLLIDADLRAPHLHTLLGAPSSPGLADLLQGGAREVDVIQRGPEKGLCFIPAGNHVAHPSELISSNRLKSFLESVKPMFDWVIIDSPPALPVADAAVLSGMSDGVLFVVRAGSTPLPIVQKAVRDMLGAKIIGIVLNTVQETAEYGLYYTTKYGFTQPEK